MSEVPDFRGWLSSRLIFLLREYATVLGANAAGRPLSSAERKLYEAWVSAMQAELERRWWLTK